MLRRVKHYPLITIMRRLPMLTLLYAAAAIAQPAEPHPVLTADGSWVPIMLIIIFGMFLAAAVIGPIVRANSMEDVVPPAHAHDEPPGASHHHGRTGTANPEPENDP